MANTILILEDDPERMRRFQNVLREILPHTKIIHWTSARQMVQEANQHLPDTCLISLDHDLYPVGTNTEDPGDGLEAAKFLVQQKSARPVIIHSSNADRSQMMAGEFELEEWPFKVVLPFGADWVETAWKRAVLTLLQETPK